jgi:hypothetical protein
MYRIKTNKQTFFESQYSDRFGAAAALAPVGLAIDDVATRDAADFDVVDDDVDVMACTGTVGGGGIDDDDGDGGDASAALCINDVDLKQPSVRRDTKEQTQHVLCKIRIKPGRGNAVYDKNDSTDADAAEYFCVRC